MKQGPGGAVGALQLGDAALAFEGETGPVAQGVGDHGLAGDLGGVGPQPLHDGGADLQRRAQAAVDAAAPRRQLTPSLWRRDWKGYRRRACTLDARRIERPPEVAGHGRPDAGGTRGFVASPD